MNYNRLCSQKIFIFSYAQKIGILFDTKINFRKKINRNLNFTLSSKKKSRFISQYIWEDTFYNILSRNIN